MSKSIVILGRQPAIGLAELESLYGAKAVTPLFGGYTLLDVDAKDVTFSRLGSCMKLATVLKVLDTTDWMAIEKYLLKMVPEHMQYVPDGKFTLGLSVYNLSATIPMLTRTSLTLKKIIRATSRPVRVVPNKAPALSTAQVLHNDLTGERGLELIFVRDGQKTIVALTEAEQDINDYTARDQARPKRDARVGMLPPKLAQTIINLAQGPIELTGYSLQVTETQTPNSKLLTPLVLDPFCGTGVILQEALLMGYDVYGTDLVPRMIDYSTANITWLRERWERASGDVRIEVGDAMNFEWQQTPDLVAAETYLGEPISQMPSPEKLHRLILGTDDLHTKMLQNLATQIPHGTRLCLAVPAWRTNRGFKHLPTLDHLAKLGYTRLDFEHAKQTELIYAREDQLVARELVVLVKN